MTSGNNPEGLVISAPGVDPWKLQHSSVGNTAASWSKRRGFIYLAPGLCSKTIWRKVNLVFLGDEMQHAFCKLQSEIMVHGPRPPLLGSTALLTSGKKLEKNREEKKNKAERSVTAVISSLPPLAALCLRKCKRIT